MKTRIISAIVMIIGVGALLYLGGKYWLVLAAILSVVAVWEFIRIRETKKDFPILMKVMTYLLTLGLIIYNAITSSDTLLLNYGIIAIVLILFMIPTVFINDNERYNIVDAFYLMGVVLFMGISFSLFVLVRNLDIVYIIYLALITVLTDTFAYFTGYFVGKHKLCEKISPKKTIEGLVGGTIMGTLIPALYYLYVINSDVNVLILVPITFVLSLIGQCGDLMFSSIKRYYGKKDFSDIIPGHGGVLDRLDSILFVILAFAIVISLI